MVEMLRETWGEAVDPTLTSAESEDRELSRRQKKIKGCLAVLWKVSSYGFTRGGGGIGVFRGETSRSFVEKLDLINPQDGEV